METQSIIQELKNLGLDPLNLDMGLMDQDRIKELLDALAANGQNQDAHEYLIAINEAFNRAEAPNFTPDFQSEAN